MNLFSLFFFSVYSQSFLEKYNLPVYNCENKILQEIINDQLILVMPDNDIDYLYVTSILFENKSPDEIILRKESELTDSDYEKTMVIVGPYNSFKKWENFNLPLKITGNGIEIDGIKLADPEDTYVYYTDSLTQPARIVFSANSEDAFQKIYSHTYFNISGLFNFVARNNGIVTFFGYYPDKIGELGTFKDKHYHNIETDNFLFRVSEDLVEKSGIEKLYTELKDFDSHVEKFVEFMSIDKPSEKIVCYIHDNDLEIAYCCYFDVLCLGKMSGFAFEKEIHNLRITRSIQHESNHILFNQINRNIPIFYSEGIQTWYEYFENPTYKKIGFRKALDYLNEDLTDVIEDRTSFFLPDDPDKYYQISGVFVDFLIESYGLDLFKKLYATVTEEPNPYENVYKKTLGGLLADYKIWLTSKK